MSSNQTVTFRARSVGWFSAGIAVALAATGIIVGVSANAAPGIGETTFVPITPCRLFDTRPAPNTIGPRNTPLGANETYTLQVTGTNGNCTVPSEASGVAMNVTAVGPTAPSFLQIWPSDEAQPAQGSSLNYLPGQAPTPNKVDVKLGASGAVKVYNLAGSVNVLGDVVGYYTGKGLQELVADVAAKANAADVYTKTEADAAHALKADAADVYTKTQADEMFVPHGEIVMAHGTSDVFANPNFAGTVGVFSSSPQLGGTGSFVVGFEGPVELGGVQYGLKSIEYCVKSFTSDAAVDYVQVYPQSTSTAALLAADNTERTAAGCHSLDVNDSTAHAYDFAINKSGGGIFRLAGLRSTWAPATSLPTAVAALPVGADANTG